MYIRTQRKHFSKCISVSGTYSNFLCNWEGKKYDCLKLASMFRLGMVIDVQFRDGNRYVHRDGNRYVHGGQFLLVQSLQNFELKK